MDEHENGLRQAIQDDMLRSLLGLLTLSPLGCLMMALSLLSK